MSLPVDYSHIRQTVKFHRHLNQKIWLRRAMRPEVRLKLLESALTFYEFLKVPVRVADIVLTGSNAAFNYTVQSDLDVHLIVPYAQTGSPSLAENLFLTKKALWASYYDIKVRGQPVELYVEDKASPAQSNGVYSLLRDRWVREPKAVPPALNDSAITRKVEGLAAEITALMDAHPPAEDIDRLFAKLHAMRQSGLQDGGEFAVDNISFKVLRALGYLDDLWNARRKAVGSVLSLEGARPGLSKN